MKTKTPKTEAIVSQEIETDRSARFFCVTDGRKVSLGTLAEFRQATAEITDYTGGSSGGGAFSALWGFLLDNHGSLLRPDHAEMIAKEAAAFHAMCSAGLSSRANTLLQRLASVIQKEQKPDQPGDCLPEMAPSAKNKVVVAIGDLHGHYPALEQLLAHLRSRYNLFEHSDPDKLRRGVTLVFTGDYIDRGNNALAIIEKLRKISVTNPGHVITLLGNHELLALEAYDKATELAKLDSEEAAIAEYRNATWHGMNGGDQFIREFGQHTLPALKSYSVRMARSGDIGKWIRSLSPFFEINVARKKILFMHADLTEQLNDRKVLDRYLQEVKKQLQVGTAEAGGTRAKYGDQILNSSNGIFWNRSFSKFDDNNQEGIDKICKSARVDFIVTGHTPHSAIKSYGNRIFDIDVGMTPKCGGNMPQALMFCSDRIVGFGVSGTETTFVRTRR